MVTEKYLLRLSNEWESRKKANHIYDNIIEVLKSNEIKQLAHYTSMNFADPIKSIIPWASNYFTETIIQRAKALFGEQYWGFLMLGGVSGGGMGMFIDPKIFDSGKDKVLQLLKNTKKEMEDSLPFAMDPVVYNFSINHKGSNAALLTGNDALMPESYYSLLIPMLVRQNPDSLPDIRKIELDIITAKTSQNNEAFPILRSVVGNLFKVSSNVATSERFLQNEDTEKIKKDNGFDFIQHEQIRQDLIKGRIGLSRNRLSAETIIEDVDNQHIYVLGNKQTNASVGEKAIAANNVAVMCLAAGAGTRWTKGAGVIKAINPFIEMNGKHRSFIEIHLAKNKKTSNMYGASIPFIVATSYLTHKPIERKLQNELNYNYLGDVYLSPGKSIGQRFIPMERDLRFLWEEMPQEQLDENKQKVREAVRAAMISWAKLKVRHQIMLIILHTKD
jgi:hypothetical protein